MAHGFITALSGSQIKLRLCRRSLPPSDFPQVLDAQPFEMLAITAAHAYAVGDLPTYHRDPFDRMLIAQAKLERLTIVTRDNAFNKYQIPIIKA